MKLIITEEDHRRVESAVAEHDPADWLLTNRVRLFSEEDAKFYADHSRAELRASLLAALISDALGQAISELDGATVHGDFLSIENEIREMLSHLGDFHDRERWDRIFNGTTGEATDEDWSRHHDAARAAVLGAVV